MWTSPAASGYRRPVKHAKRYSYVGPPELRDRVARVDAVAVDTAIALARWLAERDRGELVEPFTFVVALDGELRLAPRRSEHVALAGDPGVETPPEPVPGLPPAARRPALRPVSGRRAIVALVALLALLVIVVVCVLGPIFGP